MAVPRHVGTSLDHHWGSTCVPCIVGRIVNHGPPGKYLLIDFLLVVFIISLRLCRFIYNLIFLSLMPPKFTVFVLKNKTTAATTKTGF